MQLTFHNWRKLTMSPKTMSSVALLVVALSCGRCTHLAAVEESKSSDSKTSSGSYAFAVGGEAFVRIKEYEAKPDERFTPQGADVTVSFGDSVTLRKKSGDLPTIWLVSANGKEGWIPEYYLTLRKSEIDFLRKQKRVPATLSFYCKSQDHMIVCGTFKTSLFVVHSLKGMAAWAQATRQIGFKDNAVIFHKSAVPPSYVWKNPPLMTDGTKTHELHTNVMYYCREVDDKKTPHFDCIDLEKAEFVRPK